MITQLRKQEAGFTAMETILAIALLAMLFVGVFGTQKAATDVAYEVTQKQQKAMRMSAFVELLRRNFEQVPGNARVHLLPSRNEGESDLQFIDYPLAFAWSGIEKGAKSVIFRTQFNRETASMECFLLYLDEERAEEYMKGRLNEKAVNSVTGRPGVQRLLIMDGIAALQWAILDSRTENDEEPKWVEEWPHNNTRRPSLVELKIEFKEGFDPLRLVFWIPVMANPAQFTSNFGNQGQNGNGVQGGGTQPPGNVTIPGGPIPVPNPGGTPPPAGGGPIPGGGGGPGTR